MAPNPMNGSLLQNTLIVGAGSTFAAMCLGVLVAVFLSCVRGLMQRGVLAMAVVVLVLPPFLVTNTWLHYLGEAGAWRSAVGFDISSMAGVILILCLWLWPITTIAVWGAWQRVEPAHLEEDPLLRGWTLLRLVLLPMARDSLVVAGLITFVLATNNLSVPALLQVNVYPAAVWLSFSSTFWVDASGHFDWSQALSMSWPLAVPPLLLFTALRGKAVSWPTLRGGTPVLQFRRALGSQWFSAGGATALVLAVFSAGLPGWQILGNAQTWAQLPGAVSAGKGAITTSVVTSVVTASACLIVGVVSALLRRGRGRAAGFNVGRVISALVWFPFLVPGVLVGVALIQLFNHPLTAWLYQSIAVVIVALGVRYLAIGWSLTHQAVRSADSDLTDAARLEGASRGQMFRYIFWPQVAPQLGGAWYVVFLLCLWDVETLVLIIPPGGETVAVRVFNLLHYGHAAHVSALCLVLLGLAVLPLLLKAVVGGIRRAGGGANDAMRLAGLGGGGVGLLLLTGCSAELASNEVRVDSAIFERVQIIATRGVAPGQVNKPRSVAVDHDDNLWVLDFTGRVQKFSPNGEFLTFWQMPETARGNPKGLSVDRDGDVIVVEPHYSRVNLFTTNGVLLMQWGQKGTNAGQFAFPRAAVVNSHNEWFVSEFGVVDRVQKFAYERAEPPRLRFLASYGRAGAEPGMFNRAEGMCLDGQDQLWVADAVNHRIQVLDSEGEFLRQFGRPGSGLGQLGYPYDVCVDHAGQVFVCEFGNSRIQVFDTEGRPVEILGGPGAAPGMFNNPWGVALDSEGNLYVADSRNHRVQKFIRRRKGGAGAVASRFRNGSGPEVVEPPGAGSDGRAGLGLSVR